MAIVGSLLAACAAGGPPAAGDPPAAETPPIAPLGGPDPIVEPIPPWMADYPPGCELITSTVDEWAVTVPKSRYPYSHSNGRKMLAHPTDGTLVTVYRGDDEILLSTSHDGIHWATPTLLSAGEGDVRAPALAIAPDGTLVVVYWVHAGSELRLVQVPSGGTPLPPVVLAGGISEPESSIAVDGTTGYIAAGVDDKVIVFDFDLSDPLGTLYADVAADLANPAGVMSRPSIALGRQKNSYLHPAEIVIGYRALVQYSSSLHTGVGVRYRISPGSWQTVTSWSQATSNTNPIVSMPLTLSVAGTKTGRFYVAYAHQTDTTTDAGFLGFDADPFGSFTIYGPTAYPAGGMIDVAADPDDADRFKLLDVTVAGGGFPSYMLLDEGVMTRSGASLHLTWPRYHWITGQMGQNPIAGYFRNCTADTACTLHAAWDEIDTADVRRVKAQMLCCRHACDPVGPGDDPSTQ